MAGERGGGGNGRGEGKRKWESKGCEVRAGERFFFGGGGQMTFGRLGCLGERGVEVKLSTRKNYSFVKRSCERRQSFGESQIMASCNLE